jgi:voltage-gated potassium channel Kch
MLSKLLIAWGLVALCVVIHATGVTLAVRWLRRFTTRMAAHDFWLEVRLFTLLAAWIILLHLIEISAWALVYTWKGAMSDLPSALYFSAVTYTTTGYGDLVLPEAWRLVGAVEALTGILMCGWSTGFFFAVVGRVFRLEARSG